MNRRLSKHTKLILPRKVWTIEFYTAERIEILRGGRLWSLQSSSHLSLGRYKYPKTAEHLFFSDESSRLSIVKEGRTVKEIYWKISHLFAVVLNWSIPPFRQLAEAGYRERRKTRGEVRIPSVRIGGGGLEPNKTKEKMRSPLPKVYIPPTVGTECWNC